MTFDRAFLPVSWVWGVYGGWRGIYTAADVYAYLAGQTSLAALIIPGWAQDGGREAMLKRFANPEERARIIKDA